MTIAFQETEIQDGYLQITWDVSTSQEFHRVLEAVKTFIPREYRTWVPALKVWTIAPPGLPHYEELKVIIAAEDGESLGPLVDDQITGKVALAAFDRDLATLPDSMKERAIYAIRAALGEIDTEVGFCLSQGLFGAWHIDDECWVYQDGRYSQYSPAEWDDQALASAHKQLDRARRKLDQFLASLEESNEEHWKQRLRLDLLEKHNYRCYICNSRPDDLRNLHMHRVVPGRLGGRYIESNVVILCAGCHKRHEGLSRSELDAAREDYRWGSADTFDDLLLNERYDPDVYDSHELDIMERA